MLKLAFAGAAVSALQPFSLSALSAVAPAPASRPNIIYILADDMGLGDVSAYNRNAAWKTPNIDRLAREGMRFTDAHTSSALCTPSRYSILTGRYNWRSARKEGVGTGLTEPLIERNRATTASFLKQNGYATAMIGKWHLGIDWPRKGSDKPARDGADTTDDNERPYRPAKGKGNKREREVDYNKPFTGGPVSYGFDYFLGISASLDMPPYVWLQNNRVDPASFPLREEEGIKGKQMLVRGGIAGKDFNHLDMLPRLTSEAVRYIENQKNDKPFFLYLPLTAPHTPILPTKQFAGTTRTTIYGDFCVQVDDTVGQILSALEDKGIAENTVVIFATDNGCAPAADFEALAKFNHDPNLGYRGAKNDIYEGGHRVPCVVRWPARVPANRVSNEIIYQGDFFATYAEIIGAKIPDNTAEDSASILPVLTGEKLDAPLREALVSHSGRGSFAIRQGPWKLCLCPDSGGWSYPQPGKAPPGSPPFQLFNLDKDPGEKNNLYAEHPEIVQRLGKLLIKYIRDGRSTPGIPQKNTGPETWRQLDWMKLIK